jgi:hypothetical protein
MRNPQASLASLSEGDHPTFRRHQVQFQIRIPHLNRRPHFLPNNLALGRKHTFMERRQLMRKRPVDTKYLGLRQQAGGSRLRSCTFRIAGLQFQYETTFL